MGMWIELGVFLLVIAFALWQLHDVRQAKAERLAREARQARESPDGATHAPDAATPRADSDATSPPR